MSEPCIEEWPGIWYEYARSYCRKNLWRVSGVIGNDIDDAISECMLIFVECRRRYPTINDPRHLMTMYKMAISCWFADLSNKDTRNRHLNLYLPEGMEETFPVESDAELVVKLGQASGELKSVLQIMFNAPEEVMTVLRNDATSYNPIQFFRAVIRHLKIDPKEYNKLASELRTILK